MYTRILNETSAEISVGEKVGHVGHRHEGESTKRQVFSRLIQGDFTFLPNGEVTPFAVENNDNLMYISVHDGSKSWCWDMQVNPQQYGCVTIKEDDEGRISVFPSNPEPRWVQENKGNPGFPSDAVKVYQRSDHVVVYLAKVNLKFPFFQQLLLAQEAQGAFSQYLTGVWRENGKLCWKSRPGLEIDTLDLLQAGRYEWVKAQRGNIMPPNAVKTGFKEWCVGRVDGENIRAVSITDGMIDYFTNFNGSRKTTSGDILLLTV